MFLSKSNVFPVVDISFFESNGSTCISYRPPLPVSIFKSIRSLTTQNEVPSLFDTARCSRERSRIGTQRLIKGSLVLVCWSAELIVVADAAMLIAQTDLDSGAA